MAKDIAIVDNQSNLINNKNKHKKCFIKHVCER